MSDNNNNNTNNKTENNKEGKSPTPEDTKSSLEHSHYRRESSKKKRGHLLELDPKDLILDLESLHRSSGQSEMLNPSDDKAKFDNLNDVGYSRGSLMGQPISAKIFFGNSRKRGEHEYQLLMKHPHEHIYRARGALETEEAFIMVGDPYIKTLFELKEIDVPLIRRMMWAQDGIAAMGWLHGSKNKVLHRNISSKSFIIDSEFNLILQDFDFAVILEHGESHGPALSSSDWKTFCKAPVWLSPEAIRGDKLTLASDIYSFGTVLFEIITGLPFLPHFAQLTPQEFREKVIEAEKRLEERQKEKNNTNTNNNNNNSNNKASGKQEEEERHPLMVDVPTVGAQQVELHKSIINLISSCLSLDPRARPTVAELALKLDKSIIHSHLYPCPTAVDFWTKLTSDKKEKTVVSYKDFIIKLYKLLNQPLPEDSKKFEDPVFRLLTLLLMVTNDQGTEFNCHLNDFAQLIQGFGPLDSGFLERFIKTHKQPWYHGNISTKVAQNRVLQKGNWYLVRASSSVSNSPFTITKKYNGTLSHQRVYKDNQGFYVKVIKISETGPEKTTEIIRAPTLPKLIKLAAKKIHLENPAGGSQFSSSRHKNTPKIRSISGYHPEEIDNSNSDCVIM